MHLTWMRPSLLVRLESVCRVPCVAEPELFCAMPDALPRIAEFLTEHSLHPAHRTAGPSASGSALPSATATPRARPDGSAPMSSLGGTPVGLAGLSDPATPAALPAPAANPSAASLLAPVAGHGHAKASGAGFSPPSPSTHARPPSRHGSAPTGAYPPAFGAPNDHGRPDGTGSTARPQERSTAVAPSSSSAAAAERSTVTASANAYVPLSPPGLCSEASEMHESNPPPPVARPADAGTDARGLSASDARSSTAAAGFSSAGVKRLPPPPPSSSERGPRRRVDEEREEGEASEEEGAL